MDSSFKDECDLIFELGIQLELLRPSLKNETKSKLQQQQQPKELCGLIFSNPILLVLCCCVVLCALRSKERREEKKDVVGFSLSRSRSLAYDKGISKSELRLPSGQETPCHLFSLSLSHRLYLLLLLRLLSTAHGRNLESFLF